MEQQDCMEEIMESEKPHGGNNLQGVEISGKNFQETRRGLIRQKQKMTLKLMEGDFIYRHHVEPRVQLYVPKEETFPIPLKHIDVTGTTHTNVDVLQESRIDDCCYVDVDRNLSDSWTGFTKFTLLKEYPPKGYKWCGELTKIQATATPDCLWPEIWSSEE